MFTYSLSGLEIKGSTDALQEVEENETTARSAVYQVLGQLFSPPGPDHAGKYRDGRWAKELSTAAELLPFAFDIDETGALTEVGEDDYSAQWSRLFGDDSADGSPLRAGSYGGDPATVVAEIRREYEYFGLATGSEKAVPADHLSTACEFLGFACFKEAAVSSDRLRASYRRAQSDFLGRFVSTWVTEFMASTRAKDPVPPYPWALERLEQFLDQDHTYLISLAGA